MITKISVGFIVLLTVGSAYGASLWEKSKEIAGSAAEMASETVSTAGKTVTGDKDSPEVARANIDQMSSSTLDRLFRENPESRAQFDASPAYAVFDSRKTSFMITTGYGSGVAVDKNSNSRTYMQMVAGGVNIGYGAQFYQVVFIFPSHASYNHFVTNGWDAGADADAVGGKDAESLGMRLPDGTIVYELNDKGVMLSASLTGTKYWKSDKLNAK